MRSYIVHKHFIWSKSDAPLHRQPLVGVYNFGVVETDSSGEIYEGSDCGNSEEGRVQL